MTYAAPFPAAPHRVTGSRATWQLTRRGRIVLGVVASVPFAALLMLVGSVQADAETAVADQGRATGVVVVQPGESLWRIAQELAPDADPRGVVTAIRDLNSLGSDAVVPGQSLVVPLPAS